jgi:hypothetical protein
MDSPPIGCKERELIYISTDKLDLVLKGKPCHPKAEALSKAMDSSSKLSINCSGQYSAEIFSTSNQNMEKYDNCKGYNIISTSPLFFEYQNYEIVVESKDNSTISFWHDNYTLRDKVSYVGKSKKVLSGILNFGSEIGLSEFKICVNGEEYLTFNMEIFPSKINYQEDYII